jgi:hypothetical protein
MAFDTGAVDFRQLGQRRDGVGCMPSHPNGNRYARSLRSIQKLSKIRENLQESNES